MKTKIKILISCLLTAVLLTSCEIFSDILSELTESKPKVSYDSVKLESCDGDGFNFKLGYSVSNPYPVAFSVAGIEADVKSSDNNSITNISTDGGLNVSANDSTSNYVNFNLTYDTIISLVQSVVGSRSAGAEDSGNVEKVPLTVSGKIILDMSQCSYYPGDSLPVAFNMSFNVPAFKPGFSISDSKVEMPTADDFSNLISGMSASEIIQRTLYFANKDYSQAFKDLDLDIKYNFNLNVKNEGSCTWNYLLSNLSLVSVEGLRLASVSPENGNVISSSQGTIPVTLGLNTITAGKYIWDLYSGTVPDDLKLDLSSNLKFPVLEELDSLGEIPLNYSKNFEF